MNINYFIISCSVILQVISALLAMRLLLVSGRRLAGLLTFTVFSLMAFRRVVSFYTLLKGEMTSVDFIAEVIALTVSILLFIGILYVTRLILSEKRATESLVESEANYRTLFDSSTDGIFIIDLGGNFMDANRTAYERLGYTREEFLTLNISKLDHPSFAAQVPERFKQIREHGVAVFESGHLRKDGSMMPVEVNATLIEYKGKQAFFSVIRDITERKKAESVLKNSENMLQAIIDTEPECVKLLDADANLIMMNRAGLAMLEADTLEQVKGQCVCPMVVSEYRDSFMELTKRVFKGESGTLVFEVIGLKGKSSWLETHAVPFKNEKDEIVALLGVTRDITQSKKSAEELRKSEATARSLLDIPNAVGFLLDRNGICMEANETLCKRFSKNLSDIVGKPIWDLLPEDVGKKRKAHFEQVLITKKQVRFLDERRGMWHDSIMTPVLNNNGEVEEVTVFGFDITELIKYRDHLEELVARRTEELNVTNDQLRQAQKLEAVGLLAGGIAHDFNNILTTIKGAVYILNKKIDEASPLAKYPEQILSSIKKATDLAQSLLAFSRKQTITLSRLDLNELINDSVTLLHGLVGEHIEIVLALDKNLPLIMADRNQIQQVLINLAVNARDAMSKGGILTIRTGLIEIDEIFKMKKGFGNLGGHVLLEVSDTGPGIEEKIRGKIFEPFFTTKGVGEGSGLGLSVTYGIVKQHNGFIDFESISNKGTTFSIYLPSAKSGDYPLGNQEPVSVKGATDTIKETKTIMFAEDDGSVRRILSDVLRTEGYNIIEAKDGVEAIKLFADNLSNIDLAILDVRMPEKNGREVYDEIKRLKSETPVLFVSGYTEDIIKTDGILREGLNFIPKSATPEELLNKIRQII